MLNMLISKRKEGNYSKPYLPMYKGGGNRGPWLLPAKGEWESSRKGMKWEEQIIYIKKSDLRLKVELVFVQKGAGGITHSGL